MQGLKRIKWSFAVGLALAVMSAAAAQAATRPDDRGGPRGVGSSAPAYANVLRPDDRGGMLGVGVQQVATDQSDAVSRYLINHSPVATRPDDRAGPLGVGPGSAIGTAAPNEGGFPWEVAIFAAGSSLGAVLIMLAAIGLFRHHRAGTAALQS